MDWELIGVWFALIVFVGGLFWGYHLEQLQVKKEDAASPKCPNCGADYYQHGKKENWCNRCEYREKK
jgi:tRNA(Ile2) C34 agmatinyltransferase TiaS